MATVSENMKGYTERQISNAKRARRLCTILGFPTVENFKHVLLQNLIKNCPVTVEDVTIAEKIYGPDISALKGKSTRPKAKMVRNDWVEIPPEITERHDSLNYYMDVMYVNGMPMLTGIDQTINYRAVIPLESRKPEHFYNALDRKSVV